MKAKKVNSISFEVRKVGSLYNVYLLSGEGERLVVSAESNESAMSAMNKFINEMGCKIKSHKRGLTRESLKKINSIDRKTLQLAALGCDKERAVMFYSELLTMSYTIHMLTSCFDNLEELYANSTNQSIKTHLRIAQKHMEALLDAVLKSELQGDAEDYLLCSSKAEYIKSRIAPVIAYCMDDIEKNQWRLNEIDKCLDRIMPDSWVAEQDERIVSEIFNEINGGGKDE